MRKERVGLVCVCAALIVAVLVAGCTSNTQNTATSNTTTTTANATQTASVEHVDQTTTTATTLTNQTVVPSAVSVAPSGAGPVSSVSGENAPSAEPETTEE